MEDKREAFIVITEGKVLVNGQKAVSPAQMVTGDARLEVRPEREFVGRGALKLEAAIREWGIDVRGQVCADVGAATGGFTEVLLKHGAKRVYAIDVGRGKLALKLREDPRVMVREGVNVLELGSARHFYSPRGRPPQPPYFKSRSGKYDSPLSSEKRLTSPTLPEPIDIVTIDVSFISLRRVLSVVRNWFSDKGEVIALFKPQYEVKDKSLLKHGILRDEETHRELVEAFRAWLGQNGWQELGFMESPIRGSEGNAEYLFYLSPAAEKHPGEN